jgi:hypothetical protein
MDSDLVRALYDSCDIGPLGTRFPVQARLCANSLIWTARRESELFNLFNEYLDNELLLHAAAHPVHSIACDASEIASACAQDLAYRSSSKKSSVIPESYCMASCLELASDLRVMKSLLKADPIDQSTIRSPAVIDECSNSLSYRGGRKAYTDDAKELPRKGVIYDKTRQPPHRIDESDTMAVETQPPPKKNPFVSAKEKYEEEGYKFPPKIAQAASSSSASKSVKNTGEDAGIIEKIEADIIVKGQIVTFADIAGLEFAKKCVNELICWPMSRPDLFQGLRAVPRGVLLFGPPGYTHFRNDVIA